MLKIKDDVDLKELEKFGFVQNSRLNYEYIRTLPSDERIYRIYITARHHNIQIQTYGNGIIAKSLQEKIYDLIQAGLVEDEIKEEVRNHTSFENYLKRQDKEPDLFNQGRFYVADNIKEILNKVKENKNERD